jgi:hypothetical protein
MGREHFQILALQENIERLAGREVSGQVMQGSDTITKSSKPRPQEVALWVQGAMERLDALVDEGTRNQIMTNCGYNCALANSSPIKRAQARRQRFDTLDAFLEAEQQNPPAGTRLVRDGNVLYQFYTPRTFTRPTRCYCGLLRGLPEGQTVSPTYCQCSRGFVQKYWEAIFGGPADVQLVESCASGAQECKFAIRL